MNHKSLLKTIIVAFASILFYQNAIAQEEVYRDTAAPKRPKIVVGIGAGMLNFYGDIGYNKLNQPMPFKPGYSIDVQKNFSKKFGVDLFLLGGTLFGEEHSIARNLNFKSQIFNEGLLFRYNFGPNDPYKYPSVTPFIGVGVGYLSYVTKSDLVDEFGVGYNYWNDGSIRNLEQSDPAADNAVKIHRDYVYETEVGSGNSITIPVNIGLKFQVSPKIFVRLEETFNFTMTNKIDYVVYNQWTGNHSYDNFLYSAITLNYDFGALTKAEHYKYDYSKVDYEALGKEDGDADGVPDMEDKCPGTPTGVAVDKNGCPLDADNDGIPDYLDKEPNSPKDARVDADGVAFPPDYGMDIPTSNNIPPDLRMFDTNDNFTIESSEISEGIDKFFEGNGAIKVEQIYQLIDYFFDQK